MVHNGAKSKKGKLYEKDFVLSTLVAAICINNVVFAQSDWDAMWQGDEWNNFYEKVQYTNQHNAEQNIQQNNASFREDECVDGKECYKDSYNKNLEINKRVKNEY